MTRTTARRALVAPLTVGAALLALTACGDDAEPAAADDAAAVQPAGGTATAEDTPAGLPTVPPGTGGDEATCLSVLTYGAALPFYVLGEEEADPAELVQLLDLVAAESSRYDAESPEVHNAAVDVQTAAEEASDAIADGNDAIDALGPVVEALEPLTEACAAAGVPLG